jgi:hypothetical protein
MPHPTPPKPTCMEGRGEVGWGHVGLAGVGGVIGGVGIGGGGNVMYKCIYTIYIYTCMYMYVYIPNLEISVSNSGASVLSNSATNLSKSWPGVASRGAF